MYGLCPTLLCHLLPQWYWCNFCKLVAGICILQHPCISKEELLCGHDLLMCIGYEFEELYYQCKESWIHFVQQSIHLLTHIAPETFHVSPLACYAQWTLEAMIGNLGREIHQDHDMFTHLAQHAVLHAQTNSLQAWFPDIQLELGDEDTATQTTRADKFEGYEGFAFLLCCEEYPSPVIGDKFEAINIYWHAQNWPNADTWLHTVCCWASLQLPNGQKAHSIWQEAYLATKPHRSSCVEVSPSVLYLNYCQCAIVPLLQISYNRMS